MSQSSSDYPERPRPVQNRRELPRCRVVLHRDGNQELMFIVRAVMEVTRCPRAEATHRMWLAQHCGHAVLLITYRERAEWLAEKCTAKGLIVTVEPAG